MGKRGPKPNTERALAMLGLYKQGKTLEEIAATYSVKPGTVYEILRKLPQYDSPRKGHKSKGGFFVGQLVRVTGRGKDALRTCVGEGTVLAIGDLSYCIKTDDPLRTRNFWLRVKFDGVHKNGCVDANAIYFEPIY